MSSDDPTGPVSSNIYRPTINSTGPNLKTTLMTIISNHQNSKHDDVPNNFLTPVVVGPFVLFLLAIVLSVLR
jgi:hypothetical protein